MTLAARVIRGLVLRFGRGSGNLKTITMAAALSAALTLAAFSTTALRHPRVVRLSEALFVHG